MVTLTISSSRIDGSDVEEVLDENDISSFDAWSVPGHEVVYFMLYTEDGILGYAYPFEGEGFYFIEEWESVYLLNVSPDGSMLAFAGSEDAGDDPILYFIELEKGMDPEELDDDALWISNAVFTSKNRELLYTVETGEDYDEVSVNLVSLAEGGPETLYDEAHLLDVEWSDLAPFDYLPFSNVLAGESYCPGAVSLAANDPVDVVLSEDEVACFRFSAGAGEIWHVDIDSEADLLDLDLTLLDRDGNSIAYNDDGLFDYNPWLAHAFEDSGVYYLEVTDLDGNAGDFTIEIIEGEDSLGNAESISLNETVSSSLTPSSLIYIESPEFDEEPLVGIYGKVFEIELEENVPVGFSLNGDSSTEFGMVLFGEGGMYIEESDSSQGYGEATVIVVPELTDKYYLLVAAINDDDELEFIELPFELSSGVVEEPVGQINEIFFDQTAYGNLVSGTSDEWYFFGEAGLMVKISMESSAFDSFLELLDPDGYQLETDDDSGGDRNSAIEYTLPSDGNYSIKSRSYGDSGEGEYTLLLEEVVPGDDPGEEPTAGGGEIEIGETVTATLAEGVEDRWTFFANAGNTLSIGLTSDDFDSYLELFDADAELLAQDDDTGGNRDAVIEDFTFDISGTYTIVARSYGNSGSGEYTLSLYGEDQAIGAEADIEIGDTVTGTLQAGVEDRWTLSGSEDDQLTIFLSSDDFDTFLELFDEDGNLVASNDDGGGGSNSLLWNILLPETGEYSISARSF